VIVGAVNGDGFLTDPEGNRRYWVIDCPQAKDSGQFIDGPGAARDRNAIWKAAVLAYRSGASWILTPAEQAASNIRNGQWEAIDEWHAALAGWAEAMDTPAVFTTREAITGAGLRNAEFVSRQDEMRAADCLKRAGFKRQENATRRPADPTANGSGSGHWHNLTQPVSGRLCRSKPPPAQ
jgi:predicted P-loop ATPase